MTSTSDSGNGKPGRVPVLITAPLGDELAGRIAAAEPDRIELLYRPDLLPPARYPGDYHGDPAWRQTPEQAAAWRALLDRAEILLDFDDLLGEHPLVVSPHLRWVQTTSAGVGQLVKRLGLVESDLLVTTTSGVHAGPLTEFVFAALLYHTKRLAHLQAEQRSHHWERFAGRELRGQTMAIVGLGRIGREVARIARCFGMTVWAMAREARADREATDGVDRLFARAELAAMLAGADCVVLCVPHTPDTEGMIGAAELAALKPDVVLVNIARGVVIDEEALIDVLRQGRIGLAALDVFATEPLPADSPLWDLPNVLINPHSASTAETEPATIVTRFIENLGYYLDGDVQRMGPVLNKALLY
ncbi:MAG: D-2-hydroxyacid dehydrogenase [Chloroflexota bacterium]|nr:D-2-hydroxyacid dehydrogenase [Chloroflexota bacterium]